MTLANDEYFGTRFHPKTEPRNRIKRQITAQADFFEKFGPPSFQERTGKHYK